MPEMIKIAPRTGAVALRLLELARDAGGGDLVHVASSERRAEALGRVLQDLAPDITTLVFPAWDCLPFDRAPPSRDVMGRRVVVLSRLAQASDGPRIVVTTPDALIQRVPGVRRGARP